MDWDKIRVFKAVAQAGSLTHAGDTLKLSQSAVSRQINALEKDLNSKLFHRHARGLIVTEQGELLLATAEKMEKHFDSGRAKIRDTVEGIEGELRVTTTIAFGTLFLAPRITHLYDKYPNLKINLMLEEKVLDLPMREADVAIRMQEPNQADLIRRKLMFVKLKFYSSKKYVEKYGEPKTIDELNAHRLIFQSPEAPQVAAGALFVTPFLKNHPGSVLLVNSYFAVLQGIQNNFGIGALPDYVAVDSEHLLPILENESSDPVPVFLTYPEELRNSKKVEAFKHFIISEIKAYQKSALQ